MHYQLEITADLDEATMYVHSVDKCIAESHTDIECINSLQGKKECVNSVQCRAKVSGNPSLVEEAIVTDSSEDHYCMARNFQRTKFSRISSKNYFAKNFMVELIYQTHNHNSHINRSHENGWSGKF